MDALKRKVCIRLEFMIDVWELESIKLLQVIKSCNSARLGLEKPQGQGTRHR